MAATNNLASLYRVEGKYAQAEPLFMKTLEVARRVLGQEHPKTLICMHTLALLYLDQGQYGQAEPLLTRAVEVESRVLGPVHPTTLRHINDLAFLYLNTGQFAQAERRLREALNSYDKIMIQSWDHFNCQGLLGASLAGQKKYAEAEPLLIAGYGGMRQKVNTVPAYRRVQLKQAGERIVQLYQAWGKPEKAAEWRAKL
jgi:tetratricopeptide (TPR) repeat protein